MKESQHDEHQVVQTEPRCSLVTAKYSRVKPLRPQQKSATAETSVRQPVHVLAQRLPTTMEM
jgi:hypothetical protein